MIAKSLDVLSSGAAIAPMSDGHRFSCGHHASREIVGIAKLPNEWPALPLAQ